MARILALNIISPSLAGSKPFDSCSHPIAVFVPSKDRQVKVVVPWKTDAFYVETSSTENLFHFGGLGDEMREVGIAAMREEYRGRLRRNVKDRAGGIFLRVFQGTKKTRSDSHAVAGRKIKNTGHGDAAADNIGRYTGIRLPIPSRRKQGSEMSAR